MTTDALFRKQQAALRCGQQGRGPGTLPQDSVTSVNTPGAGA